MKYRKFGRSGWNIGEISFGAWQLGGQWGPVDDRSSVETLLTAFQSGVNFVDTAQMYGSGHSERIVGRALREWDGERVRVATKVQPIEWPAPTVADAAISDLYPDDYLLQEVDGSLRRLSVDRIDLFQLHCWVPGGLRDLSWLETLKRLQDAGKIDRIGVSLRDYRPDDGIELASMGLVDSIQVIYNLFEQRPDKGLFEAASGSDTAVIARVALDSGSLSGMWIPSTYDDWPESSVLRTMFRDERFNETLARVAELKRLTEADFETLAEAAVRFVLDAPEVSTTILGMSSSRRLRENLSYSDGSPLPAGLRESLARHEWRRNYYV